MTALHRAVVLGHYGVVKVLLDSGKISADVRGYEGITPIWLAAYHGRLEVFFCYHSIVHVGTAFFIEGGKKFFHVYMGQKWM